VAFADAGIALERYGFTHDRYDAVEAPPNPLLYIHKDPAKAFTKDLVEAGIPKRTQDGLQM
jgi:hypothetical protein